ncbi:hypothetical protein, partial [Burkholderia pseudomallei]|uniref:hypothetical protein n=1 Tax=Burkholderia pseudomallei TaxID=28450 RepID=UPI001E64078D
RRTRNPDPRKTKPHAHKNVGFVSNLSPASAGLFLCLVALRWRRRELLDPAFNASPQAVNSLVGGTGIEPVTPAV